MITQTLSMTNYRFDLMRQDPHLCFLSECGPPSTNEDGTIANKTFDGEDGLKLDEDEDR